VTGTPACLRSSVLQFVASCSLPEFGPGRYRYSLACSEPTLYSSSYAAMAQSLLRALGGADTVEWAAYLNSFQDDDGLFRDPLSYGQGWYADDPLWCGRSHLTCHVLTALACLGAVAAEPLTWLEPWRNCDALVDWLEGLDWGARVGWTGNEIMNVGTLLQYARDFHNDARAGQAMECLLDSLEQHHLNPESGVWGSLDLTDPLQRSHAVQAAYHWWPLFAYDRRPFPHVDRAVDTVLATQNPRGGFGWGVHNPAEPFGSSPARTSTRSIRWRECSAKRITGGTRCEQRCGAAANGCCATSSPMAALCSAWAEPSSTVTHSSAARPGRGRCSPLGSACCPWRSSGGPFWIARWGN